MQLLVNVCEAVGKGEEMGADDDLQVKVGKEEGAMFGLVTKGLIGVVRRRRGRQSRRAC